MSKSQDDRVMIIERGSTLILDSESPFKACELEHIRDLAGCKVVAIPRDTLMG